MAFPVAVQSAIFYVLACTPCMSARNRHRTKKKFDKERKERAALEEDEPPLYRHPSPFNVNPYWEEEIMMGPSLPKKGRSKQNPSQRKLTSAGKDSSIATRSSLAISNHGAPTVAVLGVGSGGSSGDGSGGSELGPTTSGDGAAGTATGTAAKTNTNTTTNTTTNANTNASGPRTGDAVQQPPASPTLVPDDARSMSMLEATATATTESVEGWNYKRYQREDEELWGSEPSRTHKLMDAIVKAGSSAGRLLESTLGKERERTTVTEQDRANFYAPTIIHPPVNDYHPPVVSSKPAHKDALRWMLQPPPPAKVMEGKVPVSRSTSVASSVNGTAAGRRSAGAGSEVSLTRRMALEARMRRVDSGNSALTVNGRPRATSSTEEVVGAAGASNPSRSVSRKSATGGEFRPKSQQRPSFQGRARSRSGSLTSSAGDPAWSSDEDGLLRTKWRFPGAAPVVPAMPALAANGLSTTQPLEVQPQNRPKLETILSSDASGQADLGLAGDKRKGSTPIASTVGAGNINSTDDQDSGDDSSKTPRDHSAGSSLDSGLALSA